MFLKSVTDKIYLALCPHKTTNKVASLTDNLSLKLFGIPLKCFITIPTSQIILYSGKLLCSPFIYRHITRCLPVPNPSSEINEDNADLDEFVML